MADPGFPPGGGANSPGGRQHTILPNFPKKCMKLKEFGPGGASPLRSTTDFSLTTTSVYDSVGRALDSQTGDKITVNATLNFSYSSFPVIHKVANVVKFVLLRSEG